ncbi:MULTISPECIES: hypothetical protein [unclassified Janthinobacterium]|uniref:hypothetical protein n=1 Tax=unclassified Janthinobacterium TaxID=2610881 RepID=UPI0012EC2898|nr:MULTISPECIES: hypothetical protein [unclassified Janthinobacterium]MDN2710433.1 hypothetical protein [Janthinobacterium sp. SUN118]
MHKRAEPSHLNKPFLLICLFTVSTLAATLINTDETQPTEGESAPAPVARDAGHGAMPLCNGDAFKLSAQCQPRRAA